MLFWYGLFVPHITLRQSRFLRRIPHFLLWRRREEWVGGGGGGGDSLSGPSSSSSARFRFLRPEKETKVFLFHFGQKGKPPFPPSSEGIVSSKPFPSCVGWQYLGRRQKGRRRIFCCSPSGERRVMVIAMINGATILLSSQPFLFSLPSFPTPTVIKDRECFWDKRGRRRRRRRGWQSC